VQLTMVGTTPLMIHNVRLADPLDPWTKELKRLNGKRTKTDDDRLEISRIEFGGGLYHDADLGPYLPAANLFRALMESGTVTKSGKKVERGLIVTQDRAPIEYDGPRTIEELWGDGNTPYVDRRVVNVQRQRVVRTRPIFPRWSCTFSVEVDPQILDPEEFDEIVARAGTMVGVGEYRRFYGRFEGKVLR